MFSKAHITLSIAAAFAALALSACGDRPAGNLRKAHEVAAPRQGAYVTIEPVTALHLEGAPRHFAMGLNALYVFLNEYGLTTIDITDPLRPAIASHLEGKRGRVTPGTHRYYNGVVDGNRLLAADRFHGLAVLSLADPMRPNYVSTTPVPGNEPTDLTLAKGQVYISAGGAGLAHVRADSIGAAPVKPLLEYYDFVTQSAFYPPHYLLLADNYTGGMQVLDIQDPDNPALLHTYQFGAFCDSIETFDGFVVIGGRQRGLLVVDMSDPSDPFLLANMLEGSNVVSTQARWGAHRLVVGTFSGTIDVFDLADPSRPLWLARTAVGAPVHCLAIKGDVLYAGTNHLSKPAEQMRVLRLVEHK